MGQKYRTIFLTAWFTAAFAVELPLMKQKTTANASFVTQKLSFCVQICRVTQLAQIFFSDTQQLCRNPYTASLQQSPSHVYICGKRYYFITGIFYLNIGSCDQNVEWRWVAGGASRGCGRLLCAGLHSCGKIRAKKLTPS